MKTRVLIDVTHVSEQFLYARQSDAVADGFAEKGSKVVYVVVVYGRECISIVTDDDIYAVDAFNVVVYVFGIRFAGNKTDGAID